MKQKLVPMLAIVLLAGSMLPMLPAAANPHENRQADQCDEGVAKWEVPDDDGATKEVDGVELTAEFSTSKEDNDTVEFSGDNVESVEFCVFGGNLNSGNVEGLSYTTSDNIDDGEAFADHSGKYGPSISNVHVYSVTLIEPEPETDVSPILECVESTDDGYVAYFGYLNREETTATIEIGENNKFTPDPQDRGQPTEFEPGRTGFVDDDGVFRPDNAAAAVEFDGENLVWTLDGRTATASSGSEACPEPEPEPETAEFSVSKEVEGDSPVDPFEFSWECSPDYPDMNDHNGIRVQNGVFAGTFELEDGETKESGELRLMPKMDYDCEVTETETRDADAVSYSVDGAEASEGTTAEFGLSAGDSREALFTNVFEPEVLDEEDEVEEELVEEPEPEVLATDVQVEAPKGAVAAGGGGAASNGSALTGLLISLGLLSAGAVSRRILA